MKCSITLASLLASCAISLSASGDQTFTAPAGFISALDCHTRKTVTFDTLAHGTVLFDQFPGVHFNGTARIWDAASFGGGGTYQSAPNVLFNIGTSPIDFRLDPPVGALGWFNPSLSDAIKVEFFGAGDVLLNTAVMPSFGAGVTFLGYIADAPIHRVRATGVQGQSNFTIFLDTMTTGYRAGCTADLDSSGMVDGADLGLLLGSWGSAGAADLDCSGTVDGADLGLMLGAWGPCAP